MIRIFFSVTFFYVLGGCISVGVLNSVFFFGWCSVYSVFRGARVLRPLRGLRGLVLIWTTLSVINKDLYSEYVSDKWIRLAPITPSLNLSTKFY